MKCNQAYQWTGAAQKQIATVYRVWKHCCAPRVTRQAETADRTRLLCLYCATPYSRFIIMSGSYRQIESIREG